MTKETQEKPIKETVTVTVGDKTMQEISQATKLADTVNSLKINNQNEYINSSQFLMELKQVFKLLDGKRKEITKPLNDVKNRVMDLFREPLNELVEAEIMLKSALDLFNTEQKRIRLEEERKAILRAKKEEDTKRKSLEERAKKAEEKGKDDKADMLREEACSLFIPSVVEFEKPIIVSGISTRKIWKYRIEDESKIPREYMIPNKDVLSKMAKVMKGKIPVPGVVFYPESSIAARSLT